MKTAIIDLGNKLGNDNVGTVIGLVVFFSFASTTIALMVFG